MITLAYHPREISFEAFHALHIDCFPDEPFREEGFEKWLQRDVWIAKEGDALVGFAEIRLESDHFHLPKLGVHSTHRQQGIGQMLLQAAIAHCEKLHLPITLHVRRNNLPALALYRKHGFSIEIESGAQFIVPIQEVLKASVNLPRALRAVCVKEYPRSERPAMELEFVTDQKEIVGSCKLDPLFPGCVRFTLQDANNQLLGALCAMEEYLDPSKEKLILTISGMQMQEACAKHGFPLNYELVKLMRPCGM